MKGNSLVKNGVICVCLSSMLMLAGCSVSDMKEAVGSGNATRTSSVKLKAVNPSLVKIYNSVPHHYKVIGRVSADNYSLIGMEHSQKVLMSELKKQAASLGANGVTDIHTGLEQTTAEAVLVK